MYIHEHHANVTLRERIDLSSDPLSGRNPSYCFVDVISNDEADRAMRELPGQLILGRPVKVNTVVAKAATGTPGARSPSNSSGYSNTNRPQRERGHVSGNDTFDTARAPRVQSFDRWNAQSGTRNQGDGIIEEGRRLYVGGLPRMEPQAVARAEIEKIFEGFEL